jgi:tRNA modification GTPase
VVAIAGPPNAGKSTLLNRIARRDAAIVSPFPGTTRDVIEVHLELGGYPVTLLDTAGLRETDDPVELEGVKRARDRAAAADLILWVTEPGGPMADLGKFSGGSRPAAERDRPKADAAAVWTIRNKIDLARSGKNEPASSNERKFISISALEGTGVEQFLRRLEDHARNFFGRESSLITRERHRAHLIAAKEALGRALSSPSTEEELIAEELRLASRSLGRLTGKVDVEDILDVIFRDFCIGK